MQKRLRSLIIQSSSEFRLRGEFRLIGKANQVEDFALILELPATKPGNFQNAIRYDRTSVGYWHVDVHNSNGQKINPKHPPIGPKEQDIQSAIENCVSDFRINYQRYLASGSWTSSVINAVSQHLSDLDFEEVKDHLVECLKDPKKIMGIQRIYNLRLYERL